MFVHYCAGHSEGARDHSREQASRDWQCRRCQEIANTGGSSGAVNDMRRAIVVE